MTATVAVTSELPGRAEELLASRCSLRVHRGAPLDNVEAVIDFVGSAEAAVTLLANPITDRVLACCPSLRVVANVAVGFDNIDLAAARARGVWVTNTPDVLTEATADLTWALILAVTRRLVEADSFLRSGRWQGWALDLLLGSGLQGRTLGIIGYGRIGRAVARRAPAFGMEVVYSDPDESTESDPPARRLTLDELLQLSSVVSLHCPLNADTRHLIDERRLARMRPGGYLINAARGPLVDEAALLEALESGRLAGAGLDVFEHEPQLQPGLVDCSNVVLLPHVGSATEETRSAMAELAARNVLAVLAGEAPPTPVVDGH